MSIGSPQAETVGRSRTPGLCALGWPYSSAVRDPEGTTLLTTFSGTLHAKAFLIVIFCLSYLGGRVPSYGLVSFSDFLSLMNVISFRKDNQTFAFIRSFYEHIKILAKILKLSYIIGTVVRLLMGLVIFVNRHHFLFENFKGLFGADW